ncbi:MAG: PaaI family thioesterase [Oscillospiraceae bacterium]
MEKDYKKEAIQRFSGDIYATQTTGIKIDEVSLTTCKCSFKIEKQHLNAANSVMGGAIFTLADFTFAVAANVDSPLTVSLSSQINFVGVARGEVLLSSARCIKSGKTTCVYEIIITDELENLVAYVTTTGFRKN